MANRGLSCWGKPLEKEGCGKNHICTVICPKTGGQLVEGRVRRDSKEGVSRGRKWSMALDATGDGVKKWRTVR